MRIYIIMLYLILIIGCSRTENILSIYPDAPLGDPDITTIRIEKYHTIVMYEYFFGNCYYIRVTFTNDNEENKWNKDIIRVKNIMCD